MSISNYKVKLVCCEDPSLIEGYEEAVNSSKQYDCHHRLELHGDCSTRFTMDSLMKLDLYFNRPASELIFIEHNEHIRLHTKARWNEGSLVRKPGSSRKGIKWSHPMNEETKKKISISKVGKKLTEEHKKSLMKPKSDFGIKFKEHYGFTKTGNEVLYNKEYKFYQYHNKICSWEEA